MQHKFIAQRLKLVIKWLDRQGLTRVLEKTNKPALYIGLFYLIIFGIIACRQYIVNNY